MVPKQYLIEINGRDSLTSEISLSEKIDPWQLADSIDGDGRRNSERE